MIDIGGASLMGWCRSIRARSDSRRRCFVPTPPVRPTDGGQKQKKPAWEVARRHPLAPAYAATDHPDSRRTAPRLVFRSIVFWRIFAVFCRRDPPTAGLYWASWGTQGKFSGDLRGVHERPPITTKSPPRDTPPRWGFRVVSETCAKQAGGRPWSIVGPSSRRGRSRLRSAT